MFIGHERISKVFQEYEHRISIADNAHCLTGFAPLAFATRPYTVHILYMVYSLEELKEAELIPYINLLVFNPKKEDVEAALPKEFPVNYTEIYTDDAENVKLRLRDYFDHVLREALMADTILDHLFHGESIQDMVDSFARGFGNPVFVFNAGFYLIAATYEMANEHESTRRMIQNSHLMEEDFKLLNDSQMPYNIIKKREAPVKIRHKALGFDQLVCAIDTRKDMGHIVLCAVNRPIEEYDESLLVMLKKGIYQQMICQDFVRNNSGFPYEFFLKDLLDGKIITATNIEKRMETINMRFLDNIWCLVIETSRTSRTLNQLHIRNELERLVPGTRTLQYNGEIIALFQTEGDKPLPDETKKSIAEMCETEEMYAGMSNSFSDIMDLTSYYRQALQAVELGTEKRAVPGLYCYDQYYMHHVINAFSQKSDADAFCSPKLQKLLEYDRVNGTELAYSLYMYLICERNSIAASKEMFIHRNTLIYRLKKIDALVNIDYEDYDERRYIILSYEMITNGSDRT